jgi:hypothetical protein
VRLLIFTKYTEEGPSSRYRHYQYLPYYKNHFDTYIYPFFNSSYKYKFNNFATIFDLIKCILRRISHIIFLVKKNDIVIIEYELIPYFPSVLEKILFLKKVKYILDYDDAIFHNYDQSPKKIVKLLFKNKISKISSNATYVITGSPYLTNYFKTYNENVIEIPTSINFYKYNSKIVKKYRNTINIGWLGSSTTSKNLVFLSNVFYDLQLKYKNKIQFIFCGFDENQLVYFKNTQIEIIKWSIDNEFKFLNKIDIGIMPLEYNDFNKGKCGFKLIQYMAMGIITISTPFETNIKINNNNNNLFANNETDWYASLSKMIDNLNVLHEIGTRNIEIVKDFYSIEVNHIKYIKILKQVTGVWN